jgi:hypothetical protein
MTTAYTSLLGLALPVTGELSGTWGDTVNASITSLLDSAVAGTTTLSTDADVTLTTTSGADNQAREAIIIWNPASGSVTRNITAPAQSKTYIVINATGGTQSIVLRGAGPTTGVTIAAGEKALCAWNGSDFVKISNVSGAGVFTSITDSGLTSGRVTYAGTGGLLQDSTNLTFNGTTLTAAGLAGPLNGTVGATTPAAGAFTTVSASGNVTLSGGTANGVGYLNGSKVLTSGSALTFDGITLTVLATASTTGIFKNSSTTAQTYNLLASNDANTTIGFGVQGSASGTFGMVGTGQPFLGTAASDLNIFNNNASGVIKFGIGSSWAEQMRLTSTGLGIGTSSPSQKLHIKDSSAAFTRYESGSYDAYVGQRSTGILEIAQAQAGTITLLTNGTERMRLDSSGNVGIGTSSPVGRLGVVSTGGNSRLSIGDTAASTYSTLLMYGGSGKYNFQLGVQNNVNNAFEITPSTTAGGTTFSTPAMVIDSSGNVGIGTSSPSNYAGYKTLTINSTTGGELDFGSNGTVVTQFYGTSTNTSLYTVPAVPLIFGTSNAERMRVDSGGLVGVGTTSATSMLQTAGSSSKSAFKTPNIAEVNTVSATAATGTVQYDITTQSVLYYTSNASANWTVNFRGSSGTSLNTVMQTGESISVTFLVTNGSTAYYNSAVTIDGFSVIPKWQGGTAPTSGNASAIDSYSYVILKTGSAAFTVLASVTKFA